MIFGSLVALSKMLGFAPIFYTTNYVGNPYCTETVIRRFSDDADRLHARLLRW